MQMLNCRLFGGARLEMVTSKDSRISFADIAGIDQVKAEIVELVQFLKNPKKFLDLGARSPAGVLLVGPPGTGLPSTLNLPLYGQKVSLDSCRQHLDYVFCDASIYDAGICPATKAPLLCTVYKDRVVLQWLSCYASCSTLVATSCSASSCSGSRHH